MTLHEHHHDHAHEKGADKYEQAFSKYNLHLHDENVAERVKNLLASAREQYNTKYWNFSSAPWN